MEEPACKRSRSGDSSPSITIPRLGDDHQVWLPEKNLVLRLGSSLRLMAESAQFLNSSEEFNTVDPSADWDKWQARLPACSLFWAALIDPMKPADRGIHCVLRAVLDGWPTATPPHRPRLVIDYVTTRPEMRGAGYASMLVDLVVNAAASNGANVYVLALEESCVYWMGKGFVLEQGENINARLLCFPDVHLLRRAGDPDDPGSADDLALKESFEEEEAEAGGGGEAGEDDGGAGDVGIEGEDAALQAALAASLREATHSEASLVPAPSAAPPVDLDGYDEDEEAELRAALALSMNADGESALASVADGESALASAVPVLAPAVAPPHVKARAKHPAYPERATVADALVDFGTAWDGYAPTPFTHPVVFANDSSVKPSGWADPADLRRLPAEVWMERTSHEGGGTIRLGVDGRPLNPRGRTGMTERGLLGKWGPNHAADPIVTRRHPTTHRLQMVAVQRKDTGDWAIPGGMVDAGEAVSATVRREFTEEAGNLADPQLKAAFEERAEKLFSTGRVVYRGYVDDPRNTDNAWMETTAFHYHCDAEMAAMLPLQAGDDASDVTWLDVDDADERYRNLYAGHKAWVDGVARELELAAAAEIS